MTQEEKSKIKGTIIATRKGKRRVRFTPGGREQAFQERDRAEQENVDFRKALDDEKSKTTRLTEEHNNLKRKANELQKSKQVLEQDFEQKQMENKKLKEIFQPEWGRLPLGKII
jgi:predicted RNase H-like nuclease (RuvC/YqgF family)